MHLDQPESPLYLQIADALRLRIDSGEWAEGSAIPTELELSDAYKVSRMTLRRAIDILVSERLLVKERPKGTFVRPTDQRERILSTYHRGFTDELKEQGRDPKTLSAKVDRVHPDIEVARYLNVSVSDYVLRLQRMRGDGHRAFGFFETWLTDVPELPQQSSAYYGSLYQILDSLDYPMTKQCETFEACLPEAKIQDLLHIHRTTPILYRTICAQSLDGAVREYTRCYYIGSEYMYRFDYI